MGDAPQIGWINDGIKTNRLFRYVSKCLKVLPLIRFNHKCCTLYTFWVNNCWHHWWIWDASQIGWSLLCSPKDIDGLCRGDAQHGGFDSQSKQHIGSIWESELGTWAHQNITFRGITNHSLTFMIPTQIRGHQTPFPLTNAVDVQDSQVEYIHWLINYALYWLYHLALGKSFNHSKKIHRL